MTKGNLTKQERDIIIFLGKMRKLFRNSDTWIMVFISYVREDIYIYTVDSVSTYLS